MNKVAGAISATRGGTAEGVTGDSGTNALSNRISHNARREGAFDCAEITGFFPGSMCRNLEKPRLIRRISRKCRA